VVFEVLAHPERVADRLRRRGIAVIVEGNRLVVGPGIDLEHAIVAEAADADSGMVRMSRGSASLEDLFLNAEPRT
jgi:hypothetical protein